MIRKSGQLRVRPWHSIFHQEVLELTNRTSLCRRFHVVKAHQHCSPPETRTLDDEISTNLVPVTARRAAVKVRQFNAPGVNLALSCLKLLERLYKCQVFWLLMFFGIQFWIDLRSISGPFRVDIGPKSVRNSWTRINPAQESDLHKNQIYTRIRFTQESDSHKNQIDAKIRQKW